MDIFEIPFLTLLAIAIITLYVISRRHRERMEMIRKGINPFDIQQTQKKTGGNRILFLGLLGTFAGLALALSAGLIQRRFDPDMMTAGLLFMSSGISFIIYWKLTSSQRENNNREFDKYFDNKEKNSDNKNPDENE
jgi:hypothetical protein